MNLKEWKKNIKNRKQRNSIKFKTNEIVKDYLMYLINKRGNNL